jgi:hypothetical protein
MALALCSAQQPLLTPRERQHSILVLALIRSRQLRERSVFPPFANILALKINVGGELKLTISNVPL